MVRATSNLVIRSLATIALVAGLLTQTGCGADDKATPAPGPAGSGEVGLSEQLLSFDARPEAAESLMEDLLLDRHPGDGGGRGELLALEPIAAPDRPSAPAGSVAAASPARIRMAYIPGPEGILEGGILFLQTSPFWDWQPAQTEAPHFGGYTTASTEAIGVALEPETYGQGLVGFTVTGRALAEGERVELVYGAGLPGSVVDRYAERESPIWFHVDADGDGIRSVVADSPRISIHAGPPAILMLRVPTTAQPGEAIELRLSLLDAVGNAGIPFAGRIEVASDGGLELPTGVDVTLDDAGSVTLEARATTPGVHRVRARVELPGPPGAGDRPRELITVSDPIVVRAGAPRVLWADLHGHSNLSDGTGTPEDFFHYARNVAGLDVAALTDHDHWGMRFLDANPQMWDRIRRAVAEAHEPGRFVTLLGYEWTSWLHGHRHVLYFADDGPVFSSIDRTRRYETPLQLWSALRGLPAMTFAHHSAGGAISTNWTYAPDPELEPITEIVSVHGSSEAPDSPRPIYSPVAGNYVRDVLNRGYRFGLIGSGDSHDGHPGLTQLASPGRNSGLAAIVAPERTREAVRDAMRARRVYATNGPRIFLRTTLDDRYEMGSTIDAVEPDLRSAPPGRAQLTGRITAG